MKKKSLQHRLVRYLSNRPFVKVAKGQLEVLAKQKGGYTGETVGRRLRILAEVSERGVTPNTPTTREQEKAVELLDGAKIKVEHRNKNHCFYWYEPSKTKVQRKIEYTENGVREIVEEVAV